MEPPTAIEEVQSSVDENVLKAHRIVDNFVNRDTEAVIIVKANGRYAMLDLQASRARKFRLLPDELLNENWRLSLPRPRTVKPPPLPNDPQSQGKISGKQS